MSRRKPPPGTAKANETRDIPTRWDAPAVDDQSLRMSYRIARGEQGVLTFEPYKGTLLPHWRFKSVPIATHSSQTLYSAFNFYVNAEDFVGADMARKFMQMGMTRAKRYANHKGGRKFDRSAREVERDGGKRAELPKSENHADRDEKFAASEIFKEVWRRCTSDEKYLDLKEKFQAEQKIWDRGQKKVKKEDVEVKAEVKEEDESDVDAG